MRKIILLLAAGLLLLAGCSNIVQQENDTDSSSGGAAGAFLRVTAETEGFAARKEEASARTALPTIDESAVTDSFTYTLKGTKEGGSEETLVSGVSLAKLKESQIPVTTGKWNFTLKAEKDGTVFTGTLSDKNITAGDNELSFTISWDESSLSGKGSLAFSLDWSKAGLNSVEAAAGTLFAYDPKTGTETETDYTESSDAITLDKDAHTVTYSLSNVPAGVYMIRIAFYSDAEKTNLAGTWRELAVITGGQKSGASRVMDVFVKHAVTIDPIKDGGLSGITQKTSSVEGIVTLAENTDGTYTLTSQGMGTSVLTFNGTNAGGESVAVTYNVSVSDTGELTVGSPKVVYSVTVAGGIEHGTVTAEPAPAAAGETVTLTVTPETGYAGAIAINNASGEDISSSVSLSQDSEDTTKWTFTMPKGTVTISAIFEDTKPFDDTLKTGDEINWILKYRLSSSAKPKQFKKSSTRNASATEYLDLNNKIPVWYDSSSETIYYYIPASCTSLKMNEDSSHMFLEMKYLTSIEINDFDTSAVTSMWAMFCDCWALESLDLSNFNTSKVENMYVMFANCRALKSLDLSSFDTSNVAMMEAMFESCISLASLNLGDRFHTSNVGNMSRMFQGCQELTTLDVSRFDTSAALYMQGMFSGCSKLTTLNVSAFDTKNVTDMSSMFSGCSALESLDLSHFDTKKVTKMALMFYKCSVLERLDLSSFDTSSVTDMKEMFEECSALKSLDLGDSFNTGIVTDMASMFAGCSGLTSLDVTGFDTSNVTGSMAGMFAGCSGLTSLDVTGFDTSKVTNMQYIFWGCSSLKTIYASDTFVTTGVNINNYTGKDCFLGCTSLVGGSGTTYDQYKIDATYARIDGGTDAPGYFTAKATTIGTKSEPDAVGDIVFSDGSATPYTSELTNEQKSKAVAVIFYAGSAEDVLGAKTLGVGLKNTGTDNYLAWAKDDDVNGYSTNITAIQCEPSREEAATATFTGDLDGSDNWKALCDAVSDEDTSGNYPAWEWVNAYATTANLPDDYASGWYLPTVAELSMLYRAKDTVNSALEAAGGTKIADEIYWSSSQIDFYNNYAFGVGFNDGYISGSYKDSNDSVCTVRAFSGTDAPKATAIGIKSKPDAVGDIVFSDGSATPYTADLTEEQKSKAVAVIFYAGSASDTLGAKTLGVGLKNAGIDTRLAWAKDDVDGFETNITAIQCTPSAEGEGAAATATFTDDLDGSNNWQALCDAVSDEGTSGNYPAWEWVNAYATTANLTGDYASGWYLPTVAELSMLYRAKDTVNSALEKAGGTEIADGIYWSSSQNASDAFCAWGVWFADNAFLSSDPKEVDFFSVCPVRAF